jgi:hypothetical protein
MPVINFGIYLKIYNEINQEKYSIFYTFHTTGFIIKKYEILKKLLYFINMGHPS